MNELMHIWTILIVFGLLLHALSLSEHLFFPL